MDLRARIILLIIPVQFVLNYFVRSLGFSEETILGTAIIVGISILGLIIAVLMRKDVLKNDWKIYRKNKKYLFLSIIGSILSLLIISLFNKALNPASALEGIELVQNPWHMLVMSIIPVTASIVEEIVFRYELFYKYKDTRINSIVLAIFSSLLFGLIHLANYNYNFIRIVPIIFVGLLYTYLYKKTDTIWTSIFAHFFYNGLLSVGASVLIIILDLIG